MGRNVRTFVDLLVPVTLYGVQAWPFVRIATAGAAARPGAADALRSYEDKLLFVHRGQAPFIPFITKHAI